MIESENSKTAAATHLTADEIVGCLEAVGLGHRLRGDQPLGVAMGHQRRHAVVPQATGVDGAGHEGVAQRVHLEQRGQPCGRVVGKIKVSV